MPMGWTSENVAVEFQVTREEMDALAAESFQRAEKAEKEGWFQNEIVPFTAYVKDPTTGQRTTKVITKDDGIRYGTTKEALLKVRPAFPQWGRGQTTGGNASQITDGVAAVLLMKRSKAEALGLKVIAKHVTTAVTGVAPRIMGIGPRYAIPLVLAQTGLTKEDIDLFEVGIVFSALYDTRLKAMPFTDQRGVCLNVCLLHTGARAGQLESECQRRCYCSWTPTR